MSLVRTAAWKGIVRVPPAPAIVAGIPAPLRTAFQLAAQPDVEEVFLAGASEDFRKTWDDVLRRLPRRGASTSRLSRDVPPDSPAVLLDGGGAPAAEDLAAFCESAARAGRTAVWVWRGQPICVYKPAGESFSEEWSPEKEPLDRAVSAPCCFRVDAPDSAWAPLETPEEIHRAEGSLFAGIGKDSDGYMSRFDRRFSLAISRRLIRTSVTPDQVTWASIAVGILGAALTASAGYWTCLLGIALVWFSAILDGCDGEVARLKLQTSEAGARLDLLGDHVVNLSVLAAVALNVYRTGPDGMWRAAAVLLAFGVVMSTIAVWWFFLHSQGDAPGALDLVLERIASRDFVYLLIPLAILGHLDWFFYAAALGSNAFWVVVCVVQWKRRFARQPRRRALAS